MGQVEKDNLESSIGLSIVGAAVSSRDIYRNISAALTDFAAGKVC